MGVPATVSDLNESRPISLNISGGGRLFRRYRGLRGDWSPDWAKVSPSCPTHPKRDRDSATSFRRVRQCDDIAHFGRPKSRASDGARPAFAPSEPLAGGDVGRARYGRAPCHDGAAARGHPSACAQARGPLAGGSVAKQVAVDPLQSIHFDRTERGRRPGAELPAPPCESVRPGTRFEQMGGGGCDCCA